MSTQSPRISPPTSDQYHQYYETYIGKVGKNVLQELTAQADELKKLLGKLPQEQVNCLHEPYTWTLKQLVGHLIDCERAFSSRIFRIAVGDQTPWILSRLKMLAPHRTIPSLQKQTCSSSWVTSRITWRSSVRD